MKRLLYILLFCPLIVLGQSRFSTGSGGVIANSTMTAFTNSVTTAQVLFSDTVKANRMVIDRRYSFASDFDLTVPALSIPSITFTVNLGAKTLAFISSAGMLAGVTGAGVSVSGYIVRRSNGNAYVKFNVTQPSSPLSALNLTGGNIIQDTDWTGLDYTVDNLLTVTVTFGGIGGTTTLVRNFYIRSDF